MKEMVLSYQAAGLAVIPTHPKKKTPQIKQWRQYQKKLPTADEIKEWFGKKNVSPAIIAGEISGNLEALDFDEHARQFGDWYQLVKEQDPELAISLLRQTTQNGGIHVIYRCEGVTIPGNQKLSTGAIRVSGPGEHKIVGKTLQAVNYNGQWICMPTLIETRGEGGYFLAAPAQGYSLINGSFTEIPNITPEQREMLIETAQALSEHITEQKVYQPRPTDNSGDRPGDIYNRENRIEDLITADGWRPAGRQGVLPDGTPTVFYTRPGKSKGVSATVYNNHIHLFTSNAPPLEQRKTYDPFSYYTFMNFHGDFREAARAIKESQLVTDCHRLSKNDTDGTVCTTGLLDVSQPDVHVLPSSLPLIRQNQIDKNILSQSVSSAIYDLFKDDPGQLTTRDIYSELGIMTASEKASARKALQRKVEKKELIKVAGKIGVYRVARGEIKKMTFNDSPEYPLDMLLPLGLHNIADICKGNIILLAGSPNAGKTAWLLHALYILKTKILTTLEQSYRRQTANGKNIVNLTAASEGGSITDLAQNGIVYMNSEMTASEMQMRLQMFPYWREKFVDDMTNFYEISKYFEDAVEPNGINFVDYLEIHEDFFELGKLIDNIYRKLDKGICFIACQKKQGADYAKGGAASLEKPRLVLNLDRNEGYGSICKIIKCKRPSIPGDNHDGKEKDFGFKAHDLISYSGWRRVDERERSRVNNSYEVEGLKEIPNRNYEYVLWLENGIARGVDPDMVDTWEESFEFINVRQELQTLELNTRRKPLPADPRTYFHMVAGFLNKKNEKRRPPEGSEFMGQNMPTQ